MEQFNVINFNFNSKRFESYNVIPYLVRCYNKEENKPKTIAEFKKFIKKESRYQWWARTEYEIILLDWPCQKIEEKWDIYKQVMMNIDIITNVLIKCVQHEN